MAAVPLVHGIPDWGYVLTEHNRPGKLDAAKVRTFFFFCFPVLLFSHLGFWLFFSLSDSGMVYSKFLGSQWYFFLIEKSCSLDRTSGNSINCIYSQKLSLLENHCFPKDLQQEK